MNFARLIYVIHSFVSVYGGAILIAGPAKLRWNNRIAKGILFLLMTAIAILSAGNVFWAKFSSISYTIVMISSFVVLIVFFKD